MVLVGQARNASSCSISTSWKGKKPSLITSSISRTVRTADKKPLTVANTVRTANLPIEQSDLKTDCRMYANSSCAVTPAAEMIFINHELKPPLTFLTNNSCKIKDSTLF